MPLAYGVPIPLHALPPPPPPSSASTSASQRPPTRYAIHIRIPLDVIEAIQNEPPLGQPMTIQLGDAPILQTPSQSFNLTSSSESAPHEVYRLSSSSATDPTTSSSSSSYHPSTELARSALIVSKLRVRKDLDSATLDRLKASEEAERKIKTARSTVMIDSPTAAAAVSAGVKSKATSSLKLRKTPALASSPQIPTKVVAGPSSLAKPSSTSRPPSRLVLKPMPPKSHTHTAPIAQSPLQASFRPPSPTSPPTSRSLLASLEEGEDGEVREDPKELAAGPSRTAAVNSLLMQSGPHRAESIASSSESSRSPGSNILGGSSGASDTSRTTVDSLPSYVGPQIKDDPAPTARKPSTPHSPSGSSTGASAAGSAPTVSKKPGGGGIMKGKESMKKDKAKAGKSKATGSAASTSSQASSASTSKLPAGAADDSVAEDSDAPSTPAVPPRRRPGIASRVRTASSQLKQTTTPDMAQPIGQTRTDADKIFAASIVKPAQSPSASSSSSTIRLTNPTPPSTSSSILPASERPISLPARPSTIVPPTLPNATLNPIPNPRPSNGGAPRANGVTAGGTKVYRPVKKPTPAPVSAVAPSPAPVAVEKEPAKTERLVEVPLPMSKDERKGKKRSWEETEAGTSAAKAAGKTSTVKPALSASSGSAASKTTAKGETTEPTLKRKKFKAEFSSDEEGDADALSAVLRKAARDGAKSMVSKKADSAEDSLARLKAKVRRRDQDRARDEARRRELNREEGEMSEDGEIAGAGWTKTATATLSKGKRRRDDRDEIDVEGLARRDEAAKPAFVSDLVGLKVRKKHKADHEEGGSSTQERASRLTVPYASLDRHSARDRTRNASPLRRPSRSSSPPTRRRSPSPSLDSNRAPPSRARPQADAPTTGAAEPLRTLADAKAARSRFLMLHNDHMLTRQKLTSMVESVGSSMEKIDVARLSKLVDSVISEHAELVRLRSDLWAWAGR